MAEIELGTLYEMNKEMMKKRTTIRPNSICKED